MHAVPPSAPTDATTPLRVAMVAACPFPANHGTPGAIRELAEALVRLGHEVHVVTYPHGDGTEIPGVTIHRVSASWMKPGKITIGPSKDRLVFDALLVPKLCSVIRQHRIDVIHSHNYEATIAGVAAKWVTGRPLVYNGINSMADELPSYAFFGNKRFALRLGKLLDWLVPRGADAIIALSDDLKAYLEGLGIATAKTVVMPLGVDIPLLTGGDGDRVRARHGLAADTPIVMYTGAIEHFQRIDYLIAAFARIAADHPRAVLMIANNIANAEARADLETQARQLGIGERLLFAESVALAELRDYLAAADVAVVPRPTCPGFPVKLLNYMAAGRAIVSFAGSAKSVCHGYSAYVAPNHDVAEFARGLSLLLSDPELRSTLGRRAFDSLAGVYDWVTISRATAMVYHQVCQRGRRLDKQALGGYLKAEYTPRLTASGRDNPSGFLQSGPIEYPEFGVAASTAAPTTVGRTSSELGLVALIRSDIRRKQDHYVLVDKFFNKYVKIALQHGTLAVLAYRIGHWAYTRGNPLIRWACKALYHVLSLPVTWASGVWINPRMAVGPGFVIHNFANAIIDAEHIGASFTINQGVSVGPDFTLGRRPRLGNNVFLGSGAKVLGDIDVGHNVVVAANCLVARPVADNSLIAGVPGLVIARDIAPDYISKVPAHVR